MRVKSENEQFEDFYGSNSPRQAESFTNLKQSKSKIVENLKNRVPNILDAARVLWLNRKNVKAGEIAKQQYPIYEDPFAIYRAVHGDYRKIA